MTPFEDYIRASLAGLLDVPAHTLSLTADLGEQGVDSLVGLRLARRIEEYTGRPVELEWLYDYPAIASLAGFIEQTGGGAAPAALPH